MEQSLAKTNHLKWLLISIGLGVAGIVLVSVLFSGEGVWQILKRLRAVYLFFALMLMVALWLIEALRLKLLLQLVGENLSFSRLISINLATAFVAGITPLAAGGPPAQTYFFYRQGIDLEKSLTVVTARQLLTFIFFIITIPFGLLFFYKTLELNGWESILIVFALLLMVFGISVFLFLIFKAQLVADFSLKILKMKVFQRFVADSELAATKIMAEIEKFNSCLKFLVRLSPGGTMLLIIFYTFLFWLLYFSIAPILLTGLGLKVLLLPALIRQLVYYFMVMYVPLPGASGAAELGFAAIFAALVPKTMLAGFVAAWRIITYYSNLFFGGIAFLHLNKGGNS